MVTDSDPPANHASRSQRVKHGRRKPSLDALTSRERDVIAGLVRGLTNKEIGMLLGISHRTVEIHRARLMRKLDVASLSALLEIAFSQRKRLPDLDARALHHADHGPATS